MSHVLVIGAHGKVALLAQELLVRDGHAVTGLVRKAEQADDVRATGAEVVLADIQTIGDDELATLVGEHDVVVWSAGAGGGSAEVVRRPADGATVWFQTSMLSPQVYLPTFCRTRTCQTACTRVAVSGPPNAISRSVGSSIAVTSRSQTSR
jgi:hypothetical protein